MRHFGAFWIWVRQLDARKAAALCRPSNPPVPTFLRAISLASVVCLAAPLAAAARQPTPDRPVSLDRIREELAKTPQIKLDVPLEAPVATFRTRVEQRVYMLSFEEWLEKEFEMTDLQRQSADWAAKCCGGYVLASGAIGIRLDPLFESLDRALKRRKVRKIREQIASELAELQAARKKAGLSDKP
jgi:hypothetical protein